MNLKSKKVRGPVSALGACALMTGGGVLAAGSAFAAGETLTFLGATGNNASIVAADPTANSFALKGITYGVRVSGLSGSFPKDIQLLSAPTGGKLFAERVSGNVAPANDATFTTAALSSSALTTSGAAAAGATSVTIAASPSASIAAGTLIRFGTATAAETYEVASTVSTSDTSIQLTSPLRTAVSTSTTVYGATSGVVFQQVATTNYGAVLPGYAAGNNLYLGGDTAGTYTFRVFSDVNTDGSYQANTDDTTPTFTLTVKSPADAFSLGAPSSVTAGTQGSQAKITSSVDTTDIRGGSPAALGTALSNLLTIDVADNGTALSATASASASSGAGSITVSALAAAIPSGSILLNANNQYVGTVTATAGASTTTLTIGGNTVRSVASSDVLHVGTGVTGENTGGGTTYTSTDGIYRYISTDATTALAQGSGTPTSVTTTARFNGTVITGATKTIDIASNGVSTLAVTSGDDQTTNVKAPTATTRTVRGGTSVVAYTATAKDSGGAVLANKDVTFTLGAGNGALSDLSTGSSASGSFTAVPTTGSSAGQVTVQTDANGVATLYVKSNRTADTNNYTINAASGTASGSTITTTYATTAPAVVTANNVTALVGGTATLSGKVVDQFGQPYTASGLTAALSVSGGATPASGNYPIDANGKFSATVSDTSGNTTPRNDTFSFSVAGASTQATGKTLAWRTSITPGAVTIDTTTIAGSASDTTIPFASATAKVDIASSGAFTGDIETIKGTVKDTATSPAALPFAEVTFSGSDGVYFYDADNKLSKTMTARTTSTGKLSYDGTTDGIRVLFTKSGDATITAKSGDTVTKTVTVPVELSTDPFKVTAIDVRGRPGSTITVQGRVHDAFGNLASGRKVTLSLSSLSSGNFSGTDADTVTAGYQVVTDDQGVWSTPFTSTANQDGEVTLTATLWNAANSAVMSTNPTANAAYSAAGLTIEHGVYQDTAKITVAVPELKLSSSAHLSYGSKYYARGALLGGSGADAGATVDIYAKLPGHAFEQVDSVKADEDGAFGATEKISKSTYFLVKSGGVSSNTDATRVFSGVILTGVSTSHGKVHLSANGGPSAKATLTFWRVYANGDTKKVGSKMSNAGGNGSITVSAPKGTRTYKVTFKATGTTTGSDTVKVKVK